MCTFSLTASEEGHTYILSMFSKQCWNTAYIHTAATFRLPIHLFVFNPVLYTVCLWEWKPHSTTKLTFEKNAGLPDLRKKNTNKNKPTKRGYFTDWEYDYRPILICGWSIIASLQMCYLGNKLNTKIMWLSYIP